MQVSLGRLITLVGVAFAWSAACSAQSSTDSSSAVETAGNQSIAVGVGGEAPTPYPVSDRGVATLRFTFMLENRIAEFISLHFAHFNLPATDYVVIRPTYDSVTPSRPVLTYDGMTRNGSFFSQALSTRAITLDLFTTGAVEPMNATEWKGFSIDSYQFFATPSSPTKEKVCGKDESIEAACARDTPLVFQASKAVLRLLIHKGNESFFCTGWLLGCEGHMITNHHCISTQEHASNTDYEFMGQGTACADKCDAPLGCRGPVRATSAQLVVANADLDYALIKFNTKFHEEYGFLRMREAGAVINEKIFIPQHPAGYGKRIAMKSDGDLGSVVSLSAVGCLPKSGGPDDVAHNLDTQGGSSGSPVISRDSNDVVALHHCGGCPNTAVNTNKIVADLRSQGLLPNCSVS